MNKILSNVKFLIFLSVISTFFYSCNYKTENISALSAEAVIFFPKLQDTICKQFSRSITKNKLQNKIKNNQALFVHILVPLCDNENQGIIATSKSLGDGMNLKTNLYWGAGYGIKTFFKRKKECKLIYEKKNISEDILERVVFLRDYNLKTKVYIIADAYRGDRMFNCVEDFLNSLSGNVCNKQIIGEDTVLLNSNADFLIFNGHNGMMDAEHEIRLNTDEKYRDAAVIACASMYDFTDRLACLKAYPILTTKELLPPEAYIAGAVIDAWAEMKTDSEILDAAAIGIGNAHKRSPNVMKSLFHTGW